MLTVRDFEVFDAANPEVYRSFMQYAMEAFNSGRKHMGAKMVWERMRWDTMVSGRGDVFKLNNNYTAFYVRKLEKDVPFMRGFFRTRASVADVGPTEEQVDAKPGLFGEPQEIHHPPVGSGVVA